MWMSKVHNGHRHNGRPAKLARHSLHFPPVSVSILTHCLRLVFIWNCVKKHTHTSQRVSRKTARRIWDGISLPNRTRTTTTSSTIVLRRRPIDPINTAFEKFAIDFEHVRMRSVKVVLRFRRSNPIDAIFPQRSRQKVWEIFNENARFGDWCLNELLIS